MDIRVASSEQNASRIAYALRRFGFGQTQVNPHLFLERGKVVRMGVPPMRIELLTSISGVEFDQCAPRAITVDIDGLEVPIISLEDLRRNELAANRGKDLGDLEHLDDSEP